MPETKDDDLSVTFNENPYESEQYIDSQHREEVASTPRNYILIGVAGGIAVAVLLVICICCIRDARKDSLVITEKRDSESYKDNSGNSIELDAEGTLLNSSLE